MGHLDINELFPFLTGTWGHINIGELSRRIPAQPTNPFLEPDYCEQWINGLHKAMRVDYSYGGYMELRDHLWNGSYVNHDGRKRPFHLGVDYNIPEGTYVRAPADGRLLYVLQEEDQDGGWGGKLVYAVDDYVAIIGHLELDPLLLGRGKFVEGAFRGEKIHKGLHLGVVASSDKNGGWFPHLHCQLVTRSYYEQLALDDIDGYSEWHDNLPIVYPDPHLVFPRP